MSKCLSGNILGLSKNCMGGNFNVHKNGGISGTNKI